MDAVADIDAPLDDLARRARQARIVVIGGGIAGLVAAYECAKLGAAVTLVEARERLGGTIEDVEVDGVVVATGASCFATGGGAVRGMIKELGLEGQVVPPATDTTAIADASGTAPAPADSLWGIPANPWANDVRRFIGWSGTWRAWLDRLRPPLTIGAERGLARLVEGRMGRRVLDGLVAPLTVGGYGIAPDRIDVEAAVPGISAALTRTGSLSGAVAEQLTPTPDSPRVQTLRAGMSALVRSLAQRLAELDARVCTCAQVTDLAGVDGAWRIEAAVAVDDDNAPADRDPLVLQADGVVIAVDAHAAADLLGRVLGAGDPEVPHPVDLETVTLVIDPADRQHDIATVFAAPGSGAATGVIDDAARWGAPREEPGVLRVTFGTADAPPATGTLDDAAATQLAATEAARLLGTGPLRVRGSARRRHWQDAPAAALGRLERTEQVRAALATRPGLVAVGGWLAGSGLARIVGDATEQADALRSRVLWERT